MDNNETQKKRILLMVPMLHQGGFERVCVQTARLLEKYYDVDILIFSDKDINYDVTGLNIINIDVPSQPKKWQKAWNVIKRVQRVKKIKKQKDYAIAYSFGPTASIVNVYSKTHEKTITGLRCSTDMESPRLVKLFCKKSDNVLSCSKEILRQLETQCDYHNGSYIYNPLDVPGIQQKAQEPVEDLPFQNAEQSLTGSDLQLIISVGRNDYIKGFWHLVKAFSIIAPSHPNARLLILGAGNFQPYYDLAENLGVGHKVAFPGVRKNPFPYVAASSLYVLSSNHEGFPNALLEAMALGKPTIAADCQTGPREILLNEIELQALYEEHPDGKSTDKTIDGAYGILLPDMDATEDLNPEHITKEDQDLAVEMIRLLDNPGLMSEYGKKAGEHATVYLPEKYGEDLHGIFETILTE